MMSYPTHEQILARAVRALGGTWTTRRAVTVLRDAGIDAVDDVARQKQARRALRQLHRAGTLVRAGGDDGTVEYRAASRPGDS